MKNKKTDQVSLAIRCASYLAARMVETNADKLAMKLVNVHNDKGEELGNFRVVVTRLEKNEE